MSKKEKTLYQEYKLRFSKTQYYRTQVWKILCRNYFSRYILPEYAVLDMGSGWGEFINNINATCKYAMDLNPDAKSRLDSDVHFLQQDCSQEWDIPENSLDIVFSSNFLESVLIVKLQAFLACVANWQYTPYFRWLMWCARSREPADGNDLTNRRFVRQPSGEGALETL